MHPSSPTLGLAPGICDVLVDTTAACVAYVEKVSRDVAYLAMCAQTPRMHGHNKFDSYADDSLAWVADGRFGAGNAAGWHLGQVARV